MDFLWQRYDISLILAQARPHSFPRPLSAGGKLAEAKRKNLFPRKIDFRFAESAFRPAALPEYLEGRTPKKNILSILEKIGRAQIRKARNIFLVFAEALRGGGGAFVERTI